jgi:hypothetical protein
VGTAGPISAAWVLRKGIGMEYKEYRVVIYELSESGQIAGSIRYVTPPMTEQEMADELKEQLRVKQERAEEEASGACRRNVKRFAFEVCTTHGKFFDYDYFQKNIGKGT